MTLEPLLREHRFFAGLDPEYLALITGCARNTVFSEGSFMFREDDPAGEFFLIRDGMLALEISGPGRGPIVVQTLTAGDVVGFSWLIDAHRWQFDGRVVTQVRAIGVDGVCLRDKCEQDPKLGFEMMRRFASLAVDRLQATRLQLLDVYGHAPG
jgi:CRP/FNR family cyclic AMP-dependent transcriptional regulator